jgi:hypothetical protein
MSTELVKCAGVAMLFGACGALSAGLYAERGVTTNFVGVPFAFLCAVLVTRTQLPVLTVMLASVLWPIAYLTAVAIDMTIEAAYLPMAAAGFIGGSGVAAVIGISHRRLLAPLRLVCASLVGCVAALSFNPWLVSHDSHLNTVPEAIQPTRLCFAFGVWQCAVGTYVYATSKRIL